MRIVTVIFEGKLYYAIEKSFFGFSKSYVDIVSSGIFWWTDHENVTRYCLTEDLTRAIDVYHKLNPKKLKFKVLDLTKLEKALYDE